jgi:hypothetical protein
MNGSATPSIFLNDPTPMSDPFLPNPDKIGFEMETLSRLLIFLFHLHL